MVTGSVPNMLENFNRRRLPPMLTRDKFAKSIRGQRNWRTIARLNQLYAAAPGSNPMIFSGALFGV